MARLPDEQREVIALVLVEGFAYREAADILDIPICTLTSRLVRGRNALLVELGEAAGRSLTRGWWPLRTESWPRRSMRRWSVLAPPSQNLAARGKGTGGGVKPWHFLSGRTGMRRFKR